MELFLEQLVHGQSTTQIPDSQLGPRERQRLGGLQLLASQDLVAVQSPLSRRVLASDCLTPYVFDQVQLGERYVACPHDVVEDALFVVGPNAIDGYSVLQDKVEDGPQPVHP